MSMRTSPGQISARASSRSAACGRVVGIPSSSRGARTRCKPTGDSPNTQILPSSRALVANTAESILLSTTSSTILACMTALEQPYVYARHELVEPDWTRFPGWRDVTTAQWEDVQWQRVNCVKNIKQLRELMGDLLEERFYADLEKDQQERATMSMLVPPQMMNTMVSEMTWSDGRAP